MTFLSYFVMVIFVTTTAISFCEPAVIEMAEDEWSQLLQGEWMIELCVDFDSYYFFHLHLLISFFP